MALSIAIGFVVDDAIVIVENNRPPHRGRPHAAAGGFRRGGGDRLHDPVALACGRVHPAVPDERGVVGLPFREFAVTVAVSILVSVAVALTLTPMLCAKLLPAKLFPAKLLPAKLLPSGHAARPSTVSAAPERFFTRLDTRYDAGLTVALRHRFLTLMTFLGTVALTGSLFATIPKGFFRSRIPA